LPIFFAIDTTKCINIKVFAKNKVDISQLVLNHRLADIYHLYDPRYYQVPTTFEPRIKVGNQQERAGIKVVRNKTGNATKNKYHIIGFTNSSYDISARREATKIETAYGGVTTPMPIFTTIIAPKWTRFTSRFAIRGNSSGTAMIKIGKPSINIPSISKNKFIISSINILL
jgi:hypothetical protein